MVKKIEGMLSLADLSAGKPLAWPALYALLVATGLSGYLPVDQANFWLGITGILLYARFPAGNRGGYRFLVVALAFTVLFLLLPVKTLFFFALLSALLFSVEAITGRLPAGVFPVIFLMSPVANYAAEVFSFPVRLQLSQWAASLLQVTGNKVVASGNSIVFNGTLFDVDHACMGLSMLVCSLLVGLISIQLYEAKFHRRLPLPYTPIVLVSFVLFNVAANLIRIICLVYFQMAPGTFMHEITGLACWLLYGIVPSVMLVKKLVLQLGNFESVMPVVKLREPQLKFYQFTQFGLVIMFTLLSGLQPAEAPANLSAPAPWIPGNGYTYKSLPHEVFSYKNATSLIYVKAIRGFYSTDHNPSICWRGSGYAFTRVRNARRGNALMYMANLTGKGSILYTAWWYESGSHRTNSQLGWRIRNFKEGHAYRLVNITASSQKELEQAIEKWMHDADAAVSLQP